MRMAKEFEIIYFTKANGSIPVSDFLDSLSPKMQAKVAKTIELLRAEGNMLSYPHSRLLDDGIFELRIQTEGNINRVLYFFLSGRKVVLTNGFTKKTDLTPPNQIDIAKEYRDLYMKSIKKLRK